MSRFKDTLLKDLWIKIFSLVFAIFLWMSIVGGESAEELFVVPLTIQNIPQDMIISNEVIDYVNLRLRGQRGIIKTLNTKQIEVVLNLKDAVEGENNITLFPEEIALPEGVTAVRVTPSLFKVRLDRLTQKELPVMPVFLGTPASGYKLGKVTANPARVVVMGLEETLRDQVQIETKHIELFDKTSSFKTETELKPLNSNVYIKGPQKVKVEVEILGESAQRTLGNIPVNTANQTWTVTLKPDHVTAVVAGGKRELEQLLPTDVAVSIPVQRQAGTFDVKLEVVLPGGFKLESVKPETLRVEVKEKEKKKE